MGQRRLMPGLAVVVLSVLLLGGCTTQQFYQDAPLPKQGQWALLPIANYARIPDAGKRVEAIAFSLLKAQGIDSLTRYPEAESTNQLFQPDSERLKAAMVWAQKTGQQFVVTGSVEEWRYKSGLDGEPAVGISLKIMDLKAKRVRWSASASRSGWSRESLAGTGAKVLDSLIATIALTQHHAQSAQ